MINIQEAKQFLNNVDTQTRNLEMEKVKLEQQQEYATKALADNETKIKELGCTPETLPTEIETMSTSATALRTKIESILEGNNGNVQA
jgi:chromosome segregation ATPase